MKKILHEVLSVAVFIGAIVALAGCNTTPRQIIDTKDVDPTRYAQDQAECEAYANQVDVGGQTVDNVAGGALLGAVIGGLIGGRDGAKFGAGYFGTAGAVQGAASGFQAMRQVATRCMQGRGYTVLM